MPEKPPPKPLALVGTPAAPGTTAIPPPKTLGAAGRTLWRSIQAEFSITDSGGYAVLTVACEALDRADGLQVHQRGRRGYCAARRTARLCRIKRAFFPIDTATSRQHSPARAPLGRKMRCVGASRTRGLERRAAFSTSRSLSAASSLQRFAIRSKNFRSSAFLVFEAYHLH
jgi:hypothetical protein